MMHTVVRYYPLMAIMLMVTVGCAQFNVDRAAQLSITLNEQYVELSHRYDTLYQEADSDGRAWLKDNAAPVLDRAQSALIVYADAVELWAATDEQPDSVDTLKLEIITLMSDLVAMYTDYRETFK